MGITACGSCRSCGGKARVSVSACIAGGFANDIVPRRLVVGSIGVDAKLIVDGGGDGVVVKGRMHKSWIKNK